ncbi:hypothetical protein [Sphingomicrobium nitratireducens]|uniref:hypothetical protein n=1 Tax=Sphingomicrobium nitratireducens TaxID=2964666 RepID=UPI00223FC396|nr:hypothetical protein [Sphingomicrobium nitratireducens]
MAKKSTKTSGTRAKKPDFDFDKLTKMALSREMLAAGLTAAAAMIAASPKARAKIKNAGVDAADQMSKATSAAVENATRLGAVIAEAVADAAQRAMSGDWLDEDAAKPAAKKAAPKKKAPARKTAAKKPAAKKPAAKKATTARKTAAVKKPAARKPAARKTTAKKAAPKGKAS